MQNERGERKLFGIKVPSIFPREYSIFNRLGRAPKPQSTENSTANPKLNRKGKVLEALDSLEADGINSASTYEIVDRVKILHPSRLNIPYIPKWEKTLSELKSSGEVVDIRNRKYAVDHPTNNLYRRSNDRK